MSQAKEVPCIGSDTTSVAQNMDPRAVRLMDCFELVWALLAVLVSGSPFSPSRNHLPRKA